MKFLIDSTVLNAIRYYQKFQREPSPAGDLTTSTKEVVEVKDINAESLLVEMKTVGSGGGYHPLHLRRPGAGRKGGHPRQTPMPVNER